MTVPARALRLAAMLSLAAALATPAPAAPPAARLLRPNAAWVVDRAASRLSFVLTQNGQPVPGVFKRWTAQVAFDPGRPAAGRIVLNIDAGSLVTGTPARDMALIGAGGLGASRAPRLVFASRAVAAARGGGFQALGELRGRDGSHPTSFPFRLTDAAGERQIEGEMALPLALLSPPGQPRASAAVLSVRLAARRP